MVLKKYKKEENNTIDGLVGNLKNIDKIIPPVIEKTLTKIPIIAIFSGELEKYCAVAGGITNKEVINNAPTNLIAIEIVKAVVNIKVKRV